MTRLMPGTKAPALEVDTLDGPWKLSDQRPENFTMIVFYRGLHCPVCKGFMGEINGLVDEFAKVGTNVIAVSMDPKERAEQSKADWGLDKLKIGYGLTEAQARDWGLYVSESIKDAETETFAEPGLFLVDAKGNLYLINISNMPFARPDVASLPGKIQFALDNNYPPRGTKA
ncbi:alkyl hydroperoxide reductase [Rhodobacteraceae bacterium WD3A24]|nr:alkyl hydroperoxide reductase [Rhodobacteraceae bacterium WD3A24]